jgi:hypothetical protein
MLNGNSDEASSGLIRAKASSGRYNHYHSHSLFAFITLDNRPSSRYHCRPSGSRFSKPQHIREAAMAEKVTIGLKKERPAGSPAEKEARPDIELTEEDLKQIAGGTTKAIQRRPE